VRSVSHGRIEEKLDFSELKKNGVCGWTVWEHLITMMAHTDTHKASQGILQEPRLFSGVCGAFLKILLKKISIILNFIRIGACGRQIAV
jgi:hypothetical protein